MFGSPGDPAVTWTLRDVMKTAGCGAFKDVFVLDNHLLVVKMMLQDRNLNTWADRGAEEEQARFEKYGDILSSRMAFCYGQVYLQSSRPAGQGGILFQGISFCSQKVPHLSAANAVASITVQEKLMAVGLEKMRLLFPKQQCVTHCCLEDSNRIFSSSDFDEQYLLGKVTGRKRKKTITENKRMECKFLFAAEAHCLKCLKYYAAQPDFDVNCESCGKGARGWAESNTTYNIPRELDAWLRDKNLYKCR